MLHSRWMVVEERGWIGTGVLENQALWPTTSQGRALSGSRSWTPAIQEPTPKGAGGGGGSSRRGSRCPGRASLSPAAAGFQATGGTQRAHKGGKTHAIKNWKLPWKARPFAVPFHSHDPSYPNYPRGGGPDPVTTRRGEDAVCAWHLRPISLARPLGSPPWQPMGAFSLAAPPGRNALTWPPQGNQLFWETGQSPSPVAERTPGLASPPPLPPRGVELLKCPAPLAEDGMGWGGARLEASLSRDLANHIESP